jgi:hypothetical protein
MKFVKMENNDKNAHGDKGSGGTTPVEFCQKIINETRGTKIVNEPQMIGESRNSSNNETLYANLLWLIVPGCYLLYLFMQKY